MTRNGNRHKTSLTAVVGFGLPGPHASESKHNTVFATHITNQEYNTVKHEKSEQGTHPAIMVSTNELKTLGIKNVYAAAIAMSDASPSHACFSLAQCLAGCQQARHD